MIEMQAPPTQTKPVTTPDFDAGNFIAYHPDLERALSETVRFAAEHAARQQPRRWLTLHGPSGVGKTMLAKAMTVHAIKEKREAKFVTWPKLIARCANERCWEYLAYLPKYALLIVDDLGAEPEGLRKPSKDALAQMLYDREGKWTLLTSNLDLEGFSAVYDVRIADRMLRHGSRVAGVSQDCKSYSLTQYKS